MLVPFSYVSIELIDCTLLSSLPLYAILLISSVNKLCCSLLILCCSFSINVLLLMNSLWFSLRLSALTFSSWFILFASWVASKTVLYSSTLCFLFMAHFFVPFVFHLDYHHLLSNYKFLLLIWWILSSFSNLIRPSFSQ